MHDLLPAYFDGELDAADRLAFEEHLAAMRACWGPDPVEHQGAHYTIPRSKVGPKPAGGSVTSTVSRCRPSRWW